MILLPPISTLFPYTTLFRSSYLLLGVATLALAGACTAYVMLKLNRPHAARSEEHTSELQSQSKLVCRLLLEKKKLTKGRMNERKSNNQAMMTIPVPIIRHAA